MVRGSSGAGCSNLPSLYHWPVTTASGTASVNGLDQLASSGGTALSYDGRGNLAGRGAWGYAHDVENQLTQVTGPVNLTLRYDALGRLERLIESGQDTRFLYDGAQVIAELDAASGAVKRRYVPGPGTNEVVAWYEGAGVGERRFIHQDERGSVVAVANGAGAAIATFRYGPWGESSDTAPGSGAGTGFSRFGYTGAIRLPGTDLLHMRARVHATALARFLEPDPVGFASGQLNLYAYVGGDPINAIDPSGLASEDCSSVKSQGCQVPKSGDPFEAARSRCGGCEEIESTPRWPFLSLDAFYDFLVSTIPFAGPQEGAGSGGGTLPGEGEMMGEQPQRCVIRASDLPHAANSGDDFSREVFGAAHDILTVQNLVRSMSGQGNIHFDQVNAFGVLIRRSMFGGFRRTAPTKAIAAGNFPEDGVMRLLFGPAAALVVGVQADTRAPLLDLNHLVLQGEAIESAFVVQQLGDDVVISGVSGNRRTITCPRSGA
ncbi:MAG: hypothetical protein KatS3mg119_1320 [Rhodothalassiaceae bacterium]|nr:MAG: hypothetical protein KatS3mg119_1320 [Rhodothalassiaceae bacterium]